MNEKTIVSVINADARSEYAVIRLLSRGVYATLEQKAGAVIVLPPNASASTSTPRGRIDTNELIKSLSPAAVIGPGAAEKYAVPLPFFDYSKNGEYVKKNAELTAEGAVGIMINERPFSVSSAKIAGLGFGRIGKSLSEKLTFLGGDVTVFARRAEARAEAEKICRAKDFADFEDGFDCVVNTVPAPTVNVLKIGGYVIELASAPYGFDEDDRRLLGGKFIFAPGLPGKTAPRQAGYALGDAVYDILKGEIFK